MSNVIKHFMELILKRNIYFPDAIHGKISWGAVNVCCTVEHPDYCLPKGTYKLQLYKRVLYDEETYEIRVFKCQKYARKQLGVLCAGNGTHELNKPTIYVGQYQCRGLVVKGAYYMSRLIDDIEAATENEEVLLTIK